MKTTHDSTLLSGIKEHNEANHHSRDVRPEDSDFTFSVGQRFALVRNQSAYNKLSEIFRFFPACPNRA